jgi:ComF family protein
MMGHMARALSEAKRFGARAARAAMDFVYPPVCPVSGEPVDAPGRIAPAAWAMLRFLTEPLCVRCGLPFEFEAGPDMECAACATAPPIVHRTRAALVYDDASRRLILEFKHAARTDALSTFASWMAGASAASVAATDRIVPIPLHPARLRMRRFNQSALLARALAERTGKPFDPDSLLRVRATPTQAGKSAAGRARNVAGAFRVRPTHAETVAGAHVLLVDDVRTTGATLEAAARALKTAGARQVDAVTLLRVVRPRDITR